MGRTTLERHHYVPEGVTPLKADDTKTEMYLYEDETGRPCATAFKGRSKKPNLHCRYPNPEIRAANIERFLDKIRTEQAAKKKRTEQRFKQHNLSVGDILVSSWGWEQTNVDFYKVVKSVGKCTVEVVRVASEEAYDETFNSLAMQGKKRPVVNTALSQPQRLRVDMSNGTAAITVGHRQFARPWNGKPMFYSTYA